MFLTSVFCVCLLLPVHCYNDYLTHTALDQVPATLGDDLQIRCTKILQLNNDDYMDSARCDPQDDDTCYHVWTKNGKELSTGDKYSLKSSITFDYCETFEWTTDIVKKLKLDVRTDSETRYGSDMKCYASALTIKYVREEDLGEYQCHFGKNYHDDDYSDADVQSIKVYNKMSSVQLPKKVEYFENFYTKGIKSKLLMQCVVTGGPLHWFIRSESEECPRWSDENSRDKCVNNTMQPLESIHMQDTWRCYNFTIENHNPYQDQDVTESFIYFENICGMDWGSIYCSPDPNGDVRSKGGYIVEKDQWDYHYYWYSEEIVAGLASTLMPVVVGLFFIVGGILACLRGKVCSCCNGGNLGTRAQAVYQQPVFRYHTVAGTMPVNPSAQQGFVPPQQGYAPPHTGYPPPHAGYVWSAPANAPPSAGTVNTTMVQVHPAPGAGQASQEGGNDNQLLQV